MCGIVGAIADRNVAPILLEGLRRLEYRGYDSAGMSVLEQNGKEILRLRRVGKVKELAEALEESPLLGGLGIAHTRWATHGVPSERNAHPHMSGDDIAVVHNGIIENYAEIKDELKALGYSFSSETDTEVVAHLIHHNLKAGISLLDAFKQAIKRFHGAFALAVISREYPDQIVVARKGSPLVIGLGIGENFVGSDQLALFPVTNRFIFLNENDVALVTKKSVDIWDELGNPARRAVHELDSKHDITDKGTFRHFMLKEIFEQPNAIRATLEGRLDADTFLENSLGAHAKQLLEQVKTIQIVACGTSYHAGMVAKYWFEQYANIHCSVEVASEFRYRKVVVQPGTLFVSVSQSGETADTLAALRAAKGYVGALSVCNVPSSSLVRESQLSFMTLAGPEIGVASTKAFTTQLTALLMLVIAVGRKNGLDAETEAEIVRAVRSLPAHVESTLRLNDEIEKLAEHFGEKHHALFLGRGVQYPIALEGALKLKEISYIHAEAYPSGELKHGPLALVDHDMPVITVAPNNDLLDKLKSNLQEVRARGGQLYIFADSKSGIVSEPGVHVMNLPSVPDVIAPIVYTVPLQLLAYHVAVIRGTDVDQPRNLAKSVTVE